jgi:hypothetical protein
MLKVYNKPCKNCLLTKDRIVSVERAKEIIENCNNPKDNSYPTHFTCHKASIQGEDICCSKFFEAFKDLNEKLILVQELGYFEMVDLTEDEKLVSWNGQNKLEESWKKKSLEMDN